jgi:hypothetical protein
MNCGTLAGWIVVAAAGCYITIEDAPWHVPYPDSPPLLLVWVIAVGLAAVTAIVVRRRLEPVVVLAAMGISASLLFDATFIGGTAFRDLGIYLQAGLHFRLDQPIYLDRLVTGLPADPTAYPYLYPPPTLPFAAVLSLAPSAAVTIGWELGLLAAALAGLRLLGVGWRWSLVLLAWPPFAQGLYVGNVALPLFLLFVLGPWIGSGLVVGPLLKLQSGIAGLWLVRERRWREVVVGGLILAGLILATLPLTGFDRWRAWLDGLAWFARSQPLVPRTFYGLALGEYIPGLVALAAGLAITVLALVARGRPGLARLGAASVVASPSLYAHGFTLALPALLELRALAFWAAIALTSVPGGLTWFGAIAIVVAGWFVPGLRRRVARASPFGSSEDALHPLGGSAEPWPGAPAQGYL